MAKSAADVGRSLWRRRPMTVLASTADSMPTESLEQSRAYCRDLTRRAARNFYYGLKLLPEAKRRAMFALYGYMRLVDDIADDDAHQRTLAERKSDLDQWESLTHQAIAAARGEAGAGAELPR